MLPRPGPREAATRVAGSDHVFSRIDGSWYAYIIW
jgi:hypothetical protein